jgi:hypothetical protein
MEKLKMVMELFGAAWNVVEVFMTILRFLK